MRESINYFVAVLSCMFLAVPAICQDSISYSYDSAGNRIARVASAANIASTIETSHGFPKATTEGVNVPSKIIHVAENVGQSNHMRVYSYKLSQQGPDGRVVDNVARTKSGASKEHLNQFTVSCTLLRGQNDEIR